MRFDKYLILAMLYVALTLQGGCVTDADPTKAELNVLSRPLTGINSVVFVELGERNSYPGIARDMTIELSHAVQARGLFTLDVVDRDDPACQDVPAIGRGGLTLAQIKNMRQTFQCDAILLGKISDFRPHPRMQLGISLRMIDLRRGRLLWAADEVWDSADKTVETRIQHFFSDKMRSGYQPADWQLAMLSPRVFEKFIAYELAGTLLDPTQAQTDEKGGK